MTSISRVSLSVWNLMVQIDGLDEPAAVVAARDELATVVEQANTKGGDVSADETIAAIETLLQAMDDASLSDLSGWVRLSEAVEAYKSERAQESSQ